MAKFSRMEAEVLSLFHHRNKLLTTLREHSLRFPDEQGKKAIFYSCCAILAEALPCPLVWAGIIDREKGDVLFLASAPTTTPPPSPSTLNLFADFFRDRFGGNHAAFINTLTLNLVPGIAARDDSSTSACLILPVSYANRLFGFIVLHCLDEMKNSTLKQDFINNLIDDTALALFSLDISSKLQFERDFNKDIVDTIQALMVTISPCGTILTFNRVAEKVTGFPEREVVGKYWVDVLTTPCNRLKFQRLFSETLKGAQAGIHFKAPLHTRDGRERFLSWHGSIRHNIERSQVGLVMLGIDETDNLAADHRLQMLTARWKKIFIAIQDPVLVVANNNVIVDANPATFSAARKHRDEVIGKNVCEILHDGHGDNNLCPLEQLISYQKTQIIETEIVGLHGAYMLTVTPLLEENGEVNATLLVARNLTQEEVVRAEAIRAAQLAALGELASGVAHEINNPINGIINYAQIILDDPQDLESADNLRNIISEGKRIAGIVANLLDFARCREEIRTISHIDKIIANSLQLVNHLLKRDGIVSTVRVTDNLPELLCNEQQLQQVMLNLLSNARYALNKRHPRPCPAKKLEIVADSVIEARGESLRVAITDYGIGIPANLLDKLFDPFFSTKPKGEGTGLGLSISHGLVRDHGGRIKVQSKIGEWSRFTILLPVRPC
jgi:PAS domain S-box-containing protein